MQHALQEATSKKDWQPGRLRPWLAGTVRNLSRQYFRTESRRRKREQRVVEAAERRARGVRGASSTSTSEELAEQVESQRLLSSAVMDLQNPYRETLLLFYYGGRSQKEVATELDISVRTVETRLRRAREQLRKRLEGQYGRESWALGVLPLIRRIPPPSMPPAIPVAGLGSLGIGWWATPALLIGGLAWSWTSEKEAEPVTLLPGVAQVSGAQEPSSLDPESANRRTTEEVPASKPATVSEDGLAMQEFLLQERGTGDGLEGLRLRVLFLQPASAEQRLRRAAPEFFQPQDRIWWKLGEQTSISNAQGLAHFNLPSEATHVMAHLEVHNETHSISGYSLGFKKFQRKEIVGQRVPLEMVRRTGTASGYVVDTDNNPLGDVLVDVFFDTPSGVNQAPVMTIPTEVNGSFSIPNIACDQGGFRLRPRGEGFAAVRSLRVQRYAGFGKDYPGISLVLAPARKETKALVKDERGEPIVGAQVSAEFKDDTEFHSSYAFGTYLADWKVAGETTESGSVILHNLLTRELTWLAQHENYRSAAPDFHEASASRTFTLSSGNTMRIEVQAEGGAIQGASVGLFSKTQRRATLSEVPLTAISMRENKRVDTSWWQVAGMDKALVAADGRFSFHGLPDTELEVWFGLRRRPLGFAQAHSGDTDVLLSLESGMGEKATIDVHVFDELSGRPITTYYLFWTNHAGEVPMTLPATIVRDQEGRYRFLGLDPGTWSLTAWAPQGFTTKRLSPRAFASGPHALEIPLATARGLRFRILSEAGEALEGVEISARAEDGSLLLQGGLQGGGFREWSVTNAKGQVAMSHVPAEQPYRLVCKYQGREHTFELPGARVEGELREMIFPGSKRD